MNDRLIFDLLLERGGVPTPDALFPPLDQPSLRALLRAIDHSAYDPLKKHCLVYILLKWAWGTDSAWEAAYLHDRCIPPQFAALADAYWLLDTGTHLAKAVSILSDARLDRDYVSKVLHALSLSASPSASLIVSYVRTAKPLLTAPDDIDLYALSLAQLSFMDAWGYQKSFPDGSDTRERLLGKIVGWCLTPTPKKDPLAQLLAFPLSSYEESALHLLALPSQFSTSSFGPALSSHAKSTLQDLLCVRAIQSGDYVRAIKLDRQFSSLGAGTSSPSTPQTGTDRKSIIQDLFATLPPAERTLLEDEIGKVATGVRPNASASFTPRQGPVRRALTTELSLSASWEDLGMGRGTGSPAPSAPMSVGNGVAAKATPVSTQQSPFASQVPRPRPASTLPPPPKPKFTAFGSPIGLATDRGRTLFAAGAGAPSPAQKFGAGVSLFDISKSAKNTPNAFYKPPSAPAGPPSLDLRSALAGPGIAKSPRQDAGPTKQASKPSQGENDGEDVTMGSRSDVEITKGDGLGDKGYAEETEVDEEDDAGNFITHDKTADLTLHPGHVDEVMGEDDDAGLEFSVFSGSRTVVQNDGAVKRKGGHMLSGNGDASQTSPPRPTLVSPPRNGGQSVSLSVDSSSKSRRHALPGAFHHDEEDDDDQRVGNENKYVNVGDGDEEDDRASLTTPLNSPPRGTRTTMQARTPPRPPPRSQPQHTSKSTHTSTGVAYTSKMSPSQPIPGGLMDEDDVDHLEMHGDEDTEMDEQNEEDDAIAPLPSRASRRTRSSGVGTPTGAKSKSSKPTAAAGTPVVAATGKGKTKARSSDVRTPARRSSRLSIASPVSPDSVEAASPTKKGRKGTAPRPSAAGSGTGTVATRSSTRRKRKDT